MQSSCIDIHGLVVVDDEIDEEAAATGLVLMAGIGPLSVVVRGWDVVERVEMGAELLGHSLVGADGDEAVVGTSCRTCNY